MAFLLPYIHLTFYFFFIIFSSSTKASCLTNWNPAHKSFAAFEVFRFSTSAPRAINLTLFTINTFLFQLPVTFLAKHIKIVLSSVHSTRMKNSPPLCRTTDNFITIATTMRMMIKLQYKTRCWTCWLRILWAVLTTSCYRLLLASKRFVW